MNEFVIRTSLPTHYTCRNLKKKIQHKLAEFREHFLEPNRTIFELCVVRVKHQANEKYSVCF